jgi:MFS family permease
MVNVMPDAAEQLVKRYYMYSGLYTLAASIIWGINTLFLLDAGLSVTGVFVANAAFSVGTVLFEIPTGVIADTVGRRASFLLSLVVLSVSTLLYVGLAQAGAGVVAFSLVSILIGLGFTFYSGAMEAWIVDGVRFHGYDGALDHIFSRSQIVSGAAMLTGTVGGGLIGQIDLAIPFLIRSGLLILLFALAFGGMHDVGFEPRHISLRQVPAEAVRVGTMGVRFGWGHPSLRLLMIGGAIQGGFFFWAWYAWQPYFLELLARDAVWVAGVVAALLAVSMIVGNAIVEIVTRWCGRRTTLLIWTGSVFGVAMIGVGAVSAFLPALLLLLVAGVAMGVQMPVRQAYFHGIVPTAQRATVISFDSMVGGVGGVAGQGSLGALADRRGFGTGYVIGGAVALTAVPIVLAVRRHNDDEDHFRGSRLEPWASCVPSAVPAIAHVDGRAPADAV